MQTPDYYPVLRKAVASLAQSDRAARDVLYQRANRALVNQLRDVDPPLRDSEIDAQVDALAAAVARIESEFDDEQVRQRAPQPVAPAHAAPSAAAAAPTGRHYRIAGAGVLAALVVLALAGVATYFAGSRNRADPVERRETARPSAAAPAAKGSEPAQVSYILRPQRVYYRTTHPVGSVIVSRNQRFLYIVQPNQVAIRYAIAVGPECDGIGGLFRVTAKVGESDSGQAEASGAPASRAGGAARPGAAFDPPALYFGDAHAVHRASEPGRIGQAARRGCFQAWTQDIADLYERIPIDERVIVGN